MQTESTFEILCETSSTLLSELGALLTLAIDFWGNLSPVHLAAFSMIPSCDLANEMSTLLEILHDLPVNLAAAVAEVTKVSKDTTLLNELLQKLKQLQVGELLSLLIQAQDCEGSSDELSVCIG